jgi:sec-independent protein translocase protein TatB
MDSFFGIGMFELVMIAIIALVVLGPERLPGAMREVAKYMRQLRQVSSDFQSQFSDELKVLDEINPRKLLNDAMDPNPRPTQPSAPPVGRTPVAPAAPPRPAPVTPVPPSPSVTDTENSNTILPPPPAAPPTATAGDPGLNGSTQAQSTDTVDQGPEAPQ